MATTGKLPRLGFNAAAVKFLTLLGFSPNPVTTRAAMLTDFAVVPDQDRFALVDDPGRFVVVPSVTRFPEGSS